jgi:hypothetical protein
MGVVQLRAVTARFQPLFYTRILSAAVIAAAAMAANK